MRGARGFAGEGGVKGGEEEEEGRRKGGREVKARRRRENWIFSAFPGLVEQWEPRKWIPRVEIYRWVGFQPPGDPGMPRPSSRASSRNMPPLAPKVASAVTPLSGVKKRSRQTSPLGGLCFLLRARVALRFLIQVDHKSDSENFEQVE